MTTAPPVVTERLDIEQAERINEALSLQATKGTSIPACYLEFHCVAASTALRVLLSQRHRPAHGA
jgi:hypothetical protein